MVTRRRVGWRSTAAGRAETHIADTTRYIRLICDAEGFNHSGDITADGVNHYANELKGKGRSARTQQAYLAAIKAFTRWLTDGHKLPRDPLSSVRKPNPKTDRRLERRMLLPDEWQWLRPATLDEGVERYGMLPGERVLLYAVAIETGLRAAELRSLRRGRLYLDGSQPYVTCKAGSTKNRGLAKQYIRPALAAELLQHVSNKAPRAPVFAMPPKEDAASMLRGDLADARRVWVQAAVDSQDRLGREQSDFLIAANHDGEILDFHSLRHTTGAWLAMVGEHPKVIQTIMRHSTVSLTMDTYGHLFPGSEAAAVAKLDDLCDGERQTTRATGTHDAAVLSIADAQRPKSAGKAQHWAQHTGRETMPSGCDPVRTNPGQSPGQAHKKGSPKPLPLANLGEPMHLAARAEGKGLEPSTGCPAPDFKTGSSSSRMTSVELRGLESNQHQGIQSAPSCR